MDFEQQLTMIRERFQASFERINAEATDTALALLREDIQNPALNDRSTPGINPDSYMLRAHHVGLALFANGCFSLAERLYRLLAEETLKYQQETGNRRHIGVFYANIAGACAAQGNLDQAVVELLKAAEEDVTTYEVAKC